ncbi:OLC1v1037392C1 [Oldenlandia corymbosa var. corymbosa]|uniref:OLC1v1037392C1 n=1 Tax=Oldenlandia corymbosa var. corymbosa TaxID=529605 RepID=A0AAV1CXG4_OLDCO|nr:OLC1v1037392C1 [Oldenlandia corymbosa var. corymbosa]
MANIFPALLLLPLFFLGASATGRASADLKSNGDFSLDFGLGDIFSGGFGIQFGNADGVGGKGAKGLKPKPDFETKFCGQWEIHNPNAGVAAMQLQLMPNNKAVWFDTTNLGPSALKFDNGYCRKLPNNTQDCFAHAIEYDTVTGKVRPLKVTTDPWCSSGGLAANGDLINTGGALEALKAIRIFTPCDKCDFKENVVAFAEDRWYSSQHTLEDGTFAVVGGRGVFSYEVFPPNQLKFKSKNFKLPFLQETKDPSENNLYPFLYLLPDGNLFLFANSKAIIFNPHTGKIVRNLPELAGGSRNYPASGMSVLLPLDLSAEKVNVEVMVCGGNTHDAFKYSEQQPRKFIPALKDCNRLNLNQANAKWEKETMPSGRTMGDSVLLPNGDVLMLSGAKAGTSAWEQADDANFTPLLYRPNNEKGKRFQELTATNIARMYHSSCALLADGKILVAGSNPHQFYTFNVKYPTELRVEKFSPPYLDPKLDQHRPTISENGSDKELSYGKQFFVKFNLKDKVDASDIKVTMYPPPFTTHGFSQGQRLLVLKLTDVKNQQITAVAPPSGKLAPPGYYMLFVVHRGVPSKAMWVHIN